MDHRRPATLLAVPIALALGAQVISALLSPVPRLAIGAAVTGGLLALGYVLLVRVASHPFFAPRLAGLLVIAAALMAIGYVVQSVATWLEWWSLIGHVAVPPLRPEFAGLTFGSPNLWRRVCSSRAHSPFFGS